MNLATPKAGAKHELSVSTTYGAQSMAKFKVSSIMNMITLKAAPQRELLINKPFYDIRQIQT